MHNNALSIVLFILAVVYATILEYIPEYIPTLIGTIVSFFYDIDYQFFLIRIEYYAYGVGIVIIYLKISKKKAKTIADDMKPEMILILKVMFSNEGKMKFKEITALLNLPSQPTLYYVEELERKGLVEQQIYSVTWGSVQEKFYHLTKEGRIYIMESLMHR